MNHAARSVWMAGAMALASLTAQAVTLTPTLTGAPVTGTVTASAATLSSLNSTSGWVDNFSNRDIKVEQTPGVGYTSVQFTNLGLQSLSYDGISGKVLSEQYGGTFSVLVRDNAETAPMGGYIHVSNLLVDLQNNAISASVFGGNGVGPVDNVKLWRFDSASGLTNLYTTPKVLNNNTLQTSAIQLSISGLSFTDEGRQLWGSSLGYNQAGMQILAGVNPFGSFTASAVPETSTLAMMLLGLAGLGTAARRRRAN